jgi:hypothetical protein
MRLAGIFLSKAPAGQINGNVSAFERINFYDHCDFRKGLNRFIKTYTRTVKFTLDHKFDTL